MDPQPNSQTNPLAGMAQFRRLMAFVRPYRSRLILALVAIFLGSLLGLAGPYTLQFLIDAVFKQSDRQLLNRITLILIAIFAAQSVIYFVRGYLLALLVERVFG
jgi:ABC-type bacteriocin/lantibiotic exporter with double-glycine peptidase domain